MSKTNILVLKRVKISDLLPDSIFDERFAESVKEPKYAEQFDSIPRTFTTMSTWPKNTNLLCWECDEKFANMPCFIPINPHDCSLTTHSAGQVEFDVIGNFCSWSCVCRYLKQNYTAHELTDIHNSIKIIYKTMTGKEILKLNQSPPKTVMDRYCGPNGISSKDYRERVEKVLHMFAGELKYQ